MKKIKNVQIGADIEVFIQDLETNEIVSAEGLIRGTKKAPFVFDESNKYFATSLDNVLAEFNIPPVTSQEDFYNYLHKSLNYIKGTIPKGMCVAIQPSAYLHDRHLQTEQAQTFGCELDFNAYTRHPNYINPTDNANLRSAGGHIHIGYERPAIYNVLNYIPDEERISLVKTLDFFVGIPSVLMEPENKRRCLYGKAGAFRPKPYGVEYRTTSNYFLRDKETTDWLYDSVQASINFINDGNTLERGLSEEVRETVNSCNKEAASNIVSKYGLSVIREVCLI